MSNLWDDGVYLSQMSQKLGLSTDKLLEYINKGVLELISNGTINMRTARARIDKYLKENWTDEQTAQANIALFNLFTKTGSAILSGEKYYDLEADGRIQMVRQLITQGANQFQVISVLIKQQGYSYKEAIDLYKEAMASFKMTKGVDAQYEVAKIYARYEQLFAMANKEKDYQSILVIQRDFINFFGIKAPLPTEAVKTKEQIEKEGGIVRPLVYIPDNGRDPELTQLTETEEDNEADQRNE